MLKIKSSYTLLFCLLCGINLLSAQNQEEDKLIFKALQDELNRNKNELYLPGFDKPFFISYTFNRAHSFEISASLGALIIGKSTFFRRFHPFTTRELSLKQ